MTNTTFAVKQHGTPHKARETVLLSHRPSRSFDLKNWTVSPRRTATRCSVLDTLSMLHYCGSCSKQCNNERASISSVPRHPVVIDPMPLSKVSHCNSDTCLPLHPPQLPFIIRTHLSINATLNQCFSDICCCAEEETLPDNSPRKQVHV